MEDLYRHYGGKLILASTKMHYHPTWDSIVYVEGPYSIKVERWQIEYYADVLKENLNVTNEYAGSYFDLIRRLLDQPIFWEYFSEEERAQMLDRIMDDGEFARCIERRDPHDDKPALYTYDGLGEEHRYRFVRFEIGHDGLWEALGRVFRFMNDRDRLSGMEYERLSSEEDVSTLIKEVTEPTEKELIIKQLGQYVNRLLELEMTEGDIMTTIRSCMPSDVHRLVVTSDYKIHVSRFHIVGNKNYHSYQEIKMSPLDKAVYILFLKHPEGINFSYLPDYRGELMEIYKKLMNYRTTAAMLRSVEDVTDPTKNSINEKCARIRRAFVEAFGSYKAEPYCISGLRGEAKRITLDRQYVDWVE